MDEYIIKILRFTKNYPSTNPNSIIIGFNIYCLTNKRTFYKEIKILHNDVKNFLNNDEKIIDFAWEKMKPFFYNWSQDNKKKHRITGKEFRALI